MLRLKFAFLFSLIGLLVTSCTPEEDWSTVEYVQYRLELSDPEAFRRLEHLEDAEQATLVPTLIDVFNSGLRKEESLRALVSIGDARANDIFLSGLQATDDALAALAARGLANLGDSSSATAVAQRLAQVTQHEAYAGFLDALKQIPTPQAADVIAAMMMRPAERIGGINTVRQGCTILGSVENPSDDVLNALVFGLVNFVPEPFQDALNECELGLLAHGDAPIGKLSEVLREENVTVNTRLTSMGYNTVVGSLRAGAVLAHNGSPAAQNVLIQWFSTPREIPVAELEAMTADEAVAWYDHHGQLFTIATRGLAYANSESALSALRRLESLEGETSMLANFRIWFQLSSGAEFGLRTIVQESLMKIGNDTDRELLWSRAAEGTVPTSRGAYFQIEFRKNALHYVGRTARAGEMERFTTLINAQSTPLQFLMHLGYFALAEACADDIACYIGCLTELGPVTGHESVTTAVGALEDEAVRNQALAGITQNARTGAIWQLALRFGDNPTAVEALLGNLQNPSMAARFETVEALHFVDALPADAGDRFDAFIEEQADSNAPQARELRHATRLLKSIRL
jgi:hypothetical protein